VQGHLAEQLKSNKGNLEPNHRTQILYSVE